ncbi:hypothetical protein BU15DRAFT_49282, partial [Melanogaster broomeanus]
HVLKQHVGITADKLHAWETASRCAVRVANGLGLMVISMHPKFSAHRFAGQAILAGGAVFSGSIMALALFEEYVLRFLGLVTPLSGIIMIAG